MLLFNMKIYFFQDEKLKPATAHIRTERVIDNKRECRRGAWTREAIQRLKQARGFCGRESMHLQKINSRGMEG
jgi:hypothetical protein